jgi:hypothetical protein
MSAAERAYQLLLHAYPATFRAAYGREMMLVFRDQRREVGAPGIRFWAELVRELVRSAAAERVDELRAWWDRDIQTEEEKMKPMATLAILIGALEVVNGSVELWAGGIRNGDGYSLAWGTMVALIGTLLVASGIALLRRAPSAAALARGAAVACLAVFACMFFVQGRMSVFATLLGTVFPVALLIFLYWDRGQSAPRVA